MISYKFGIAPASNKKTDNKEKCADKYKITIFFFQKSYKPTISSSFLEFFGMVKILFVLIARVVIDEPHQQTLVTVIWLL